MLDWYQQLPLHINPIAFSIGSFSIRWYAISYLIAFGLVYLLLVLRIWKGEMGFSLKKFDVFDFIMFAFIAALLSGRIGYVLLYNFPYFQAHPLAIVSPYDISTGHYIGIYGMSYHGALVGVIVAIWYFCKSSGIRFWQWADFIAPAIPAGYFFGRIGNFLNGELYGRMTHSPLGMYFAQDPISLRHPSQLYEALGEGLLLFVILWAVRNKKYRPGTISMIYVIGYGVMRFVIEFFRQPDPQIGFLAGHFTLGQVLCGIMIIGGTLFLTWGKTKKVIQ